MKQLAFETLRRGDSVPHRLRRHRDRAAATLGRMWPTHERRPTWALPPPGAEIKLVPIEGYVRDARQGPAHHAGLLAPARAHRAGVRRGGLLPARRCVCASKTENPPKGLLFRGRIAEDFKLTTGTWVHVGPLRARFIEHFAPLVRDVVIAGEGRERGRRPAVSGRKGFP